MARNYFYSREYIAELIKRDLENRLNQELIQGENFGVAHFPNGSYTVVMLGDNSEDIYPEVLPTYNQNRATTESEEDSEGFVVFHNNNHDEQQNTEPSTSNPIVTDPDGILELISWAIEHQRMLEIVYRKNLGDGHYERSARIITPLRIRENYLSTMLHVTMRDNGSLEYTTKEDNKRTFIVSLIEKARVYVA